MRLPLVDVHIFLTTHPSIDGFQRDTATTKRNRICAARNVSAKSAVPSSLRRHVRVVHFRDETAWLEHSLEWDGRGGRTGATTVRRENNRERER